MPFKAPVPRFKPKGNPQIKQGLSGLEWAKKKLPKRYFLSLLRLTNPVLYREVMREGEYVVEPHNYSSDTKVFTIGLHDKEKKGSLVATGQGVIFKEGSKIIDPTSWYIDGFTGKPSFEYLGTAPKGKGDILQVDTVKPLNRKEATAFNKIGIRATKPVTQEELMQMDAWVSEKLDRGELLKDIKQEANLKLGEGAIEQTLGLSSLAQKYLGPDIKPKAGHGEMFFGGLPLDVGVKDTLGGLTTLGERIPSVGILRGERTTGSAFVDTGEGAFTGSGKKVEKPMKRTWKKNEKFKNIPDIDHIKNRFYKTLQDSVLSYTENLTKNVGDQNTYRNKLQELAPKLLVGEDIDAILKATQNTVHEDNYLSAITTSKGTKDYPNLTAEGVAKLPQKQLELPKRENK
jgi:hypothetical protein